MKISIGFNNVQCLMTGVMYASFKGRDCTLHYSDGSTESASVGPELAAQVNAYYAYQKENGPEVEPPCLFSIVSAVQSERNKQHENTLATESYLNGK